MCVSIGWCDSSTDLTYRDDTVRFTDLLSLKELNAVKLEEQPITVRCAGDQAVVVSLR